MALYVSPIGRVFFSVGFFFFDTNMFCFRWCYGCWYWLSVGVGFYYFLVGVVVQTFICITIWVKRFMVLVAGMMYGDFFVVLLIIIDPYCGVNVRVELLGCEGVAVVGVYSHLLAYGVVEGVDVPGGEAVVGGGELSTLYGGIHLSCRDGGLID